MLASSPCSNSSSSAAATRTTPAQARRVAPVAVASLPETRHGCCSSMPPSRSSQRRRRLAALPPLRAISIDRRAHMELAWKRQAEEEAALAALASLAENNSVVGIIGGDKGENVHPNDDAAKGPLSFGAKRRLLSCPPGSVTRLRSVAHLVRRLLCSSSLALRECARARERKTLKKAHFQKLKKTLSPPPQKTNKTRTPSPRRQPPPSSPSPSTPAPAAPARRPCVPGRTPRARRARAARESSF